MIDKSYDHASDPRRLMEVTCDANAIPSVLFHQVMVLSRGRIMTYKVVDLQKVSRVNHILGEYFVLCVPCPLCHFSKKNNVQTFDKITGLGTHKDI